MTNSDTPTCLTNIQMECLFFILRGKTMKATAEVLQISPKEVARHFDKIKVQLDCPRKEDVIEKAIMQGYLGFIPQNLLTKNLKYQLGY